MSLISSVSGIRGTIGGVPGEGLTPFDVVGFSAAYGKYIVEKNQGHTPVRVVIGRDARISGEQVCEFVSNTLIAMGIDTIELGLATTPTVELAVVEEGAEGGIIITASHNPEDWNALKLLNEKGEFLSPEDGEKINRYREDARFHFATVHQMGIRIMKDNYLDYHIEKILALETVDADAIRKRDFSVFVDGINSVGGIAVPRLLKKLGVRKIEVINNKPTGRFAHNPEPLPEHLSEISAKIKDNKGDLGIVVDPDVDRLAIMGEDGTPFGEEYTLVAIADYILQHMPGEVVSNLSSSNVLGWVAKKYNHVRHTSAVGEVHVVRKMKEVNAVIGGEGNGGVIYPVLHYGRDALVGIALFLTYLARSGHSVTSLKQQYPSMFMKKEKIQIPEGLDTTTIFSKIEEAFPGARTDHTDGLYLAMEDTWIHIRKSNTEPIFRIYTEAPSPKIAEELTATVKRIIL